MIITTNLKIIYGITYGLKLRNKKFKENKVATTTLHCGIVYEGLVGSQQHKIDVQYFGLDLNALHCFHDVANAYGTNLLLTEMIYVNIPECMKVKCRKIDIIKFPFYPNPIDIYAIDLRLANV